MATGFGQNVWAGFGEESSYGTPVTRTKFVEIVSENIRLVKAPVKRGPLYDEAQRYWIPGRKSVEGGVRAEMLYEGFELPLKHLLGAGVTSSLGSGAYQHTFTPTLQPPTALTIEVNRDVASFVYHGCQIQSVTLENAVDGVVQFAMDVLGEDETTAIASTPSFPGDKPIHYAQTVTITAGSDTVQAESVRLTIANALAGDRYKLGSRLRRGLGRGGKRVVSGSFVAEFEDFTQYNNYVSETEKALTISWQGGLISGSNYYKLTCSLPRVLITGDTPTVGGPGPIKASVNFDAFYVPGAADELTVMLVNTVASI